MTASPPPTKGYLPVSPFAILIIFTTINLLSYFDRGALSSVLSSLDDSFPDMTSVKQGLLGSAFMGGYMLGSPVMASLIRHIEPFFVKAIGLSLWVVATTVCCFSPSYPALFVGRVLSGFGEAGFLCIAPPFLDRVAPAEKKSLWLSIFYSAIPVGYALGFATSGAVVNANFLDHNTWRVIFGAESLIMIPFIIFALICRSPYSFHADASSTDSENHTHVDTLDDLEARGETTEAALLAANADSIAIGSTNSAYFNESDSDMLFSPMHFPRIIASALLRQLWCLFLNPLYTSMVVGYAMQTFVTGGFAFYGMIYVQTIYGINAAQAGMIFGGITVVAGVFGSLAGGMILDALRKSSAITPEHAQSSAATETSEVSHFEESLLENSSDDINASQDISTTTTTTTTATPTKADSAPPNLRDRNIITERLHSIELAFRLIILSTAIATPFAMLAFCMNSLFFFTLWLLIAEITMFICFSPINNVVMWAVPFNLTPQAMAFSVVIVHLLGDASSPTIIGLLLTITHNQYRVVMLICCLPLTIAVLFWSLGAGYLSRLQKSIQSYQPTDEENIINDDILTSQATLLDRAFISIRRNLQWPLAERIDEPVRH